MKHTPALVPNPCPESWDSLTPEDRGHFCAACETKVWDLSSMTQQEAKTLLRERAGHHLCVSYREQPNGEVAYRPEPLVPATSLMRRLPAAAGLSFVLAACTPTGGEQAPPRDKQATPTPTPADITNRAPLGSKPTTLRIKGKWEEPEPPAPEQPIKKGKPREPDPPPKKGKVAAPEHDDEGDEQDRQIKGLLHEVD